MTTDTTKNYQKQKRDQMGRFQSNPTTSTGSSKKKKKNSKNLAQTVTDNKKVINHIALVVDNSGSMGHLQDDVIKAVNEQLRNIADQDRLLGQTSFITLIKFGRNVTTVYREYPAHIAILIDRFSLPTNESSTRLLDGVLEAVDSFQHLKIDAMENEAFLIITLTDGHENASRNINSLEFQKLIKTLQKTDKWSFIFLVPPGNKSYITNLGVPSGNVQEWEQTSKGVEKFTDQTQSAYKQYSTVRASGAMSTQSFYVDMSNVTEQKAADKLQNVTSVYVEKKIEHEIPISQFVEAKMKRPYMSYKGKCFYELTKTEYLQDYKNILLMSRKSKDIFGGPEAKKLIGLTSSASKVLVKPLDFGKWRIFVQSTSDNRILVRGTSLLIEK